MSNQEVRTKLIIFPQKIFGNWIWLKQVDFIYEWKDTGLDPYGCQYEWVKIRPVTALEKVLHEN